jgi:hypothetical protein
MVGMTLDIQGFERQIESLKQRILLGVNDGLNNAQEYLKSIMQFYIAQTVYSIYSPVMYNRTRDLYNNVTVRVEGNSIYVYVDDTGMDKTKDGVTYPHRVLEGHNTYPYDYIPQSGWSAYMNERNWVEATRDEFINHMNQSQIFMQKVIEAIQKRI